MMGQSSQSKSRRSWSKAEEDALLSILEDVVASEFRCDNGSFKPGTMVHVEKALEARFPNSGIKANPHIDSRLRHWKKQYGIVFDMLNTSGFAWNDVLKCIEVDSDEAWDNYIKHNKNAEGWRGKQFAIFDRLANIFGKDRATGRSAETPIDMVEEVNRENYNINAIDMEESSSISVQNRSTATSTHKRKKIADCNNAEDVLLASFQQMFDKSIDQLKVIADTLVKGHEDRSDISNELKNMGLSIEDQLDVFGLIVEKPQYLTMFRSTDGPVREMFVRRLLRQLRGGSSSLDD